MPKNFDDIVSQDREFIIGGQVFKWRVVHWRVFAKWFDEAITSQNGDESTVVESLEEVINRVLLYLDPADHKRFKEVVENEENPVSILQLNELATWLLEEQTNRPTTPPSPSGGGRGRTARTSQAASS